MAVADASVLIILAKIGQLALLRSVYGNVVISPTVKEEVVDRGRQVGALEVDHVQQALDQGWLRVESLTAAARHIRQQLMHNTTLDIGEIEALALAKTRRELLLVDDKEARTMATAMKVTRVGTAGVLLEAYLAGHFDLRELEKAVGDMAEVLWVAPGVIADILRRAREAKR